MTYKSTQQNHDWMGRTGSYATRVVLHANVSPRQHAKFEEGRLAGLRDEKQRLLGAVAERGMNPRWSARLGEITMEIKRLNREAAATNEVSVMWEALRQVLDKETLERVNQKMIWLRMRAEGCADAEIEAVFGQRAAKRHAMAEQK